MSKPDIDVAGWSAILTVPEGFRHTGDTAIAPRRAAPRRTAPRIGGRYGDGDRMAKAMAGLANSVGTAVTENADIGSSMKTGGFPKSLIFLLTLTA
jgi:hypothetical protein